MNPSDASRWQRVKELFQAALERPTEARPTFLDEACGDDQLRRDVVCLLTAHEKADGFLEPRAHALAALTVGSRLGPYEIVARIPRSDAGKINRGTLAAERSNLPDHYT